jgi:probable rRNA maturation factor
MPIQFIFTNASITLSNRKKLKQFIEYTFRQKEKKLMSLAIIFCTDEYLLDINRRFLQHDYYTDIITFNLSENSETIEGEIYISLDRIKENALTNNVSRKDELHRVIFHGVLHLCGYKDKSKADKKSMTLMEDRTLRNYLNNKNTA